MMDEDGVRRDSLREGLKVKGRSRRCIAMLVNNAH